MKNYWLDNMDKKSMKDILAAYGIEIPGLEKVHIKLPERSFYDFYKEFDTMAELIASVEFKEIFSEQIFAKRKNMVDLKE